MIILHDILKSIGHEMRNNGFAELEYDDGLGIFYYINLGDLAKFYQLDIMKRIGYIRISGSIGFSIMDKSINGGIDIKEALIPKNGCTFSLRLENFPHLIKLGSIKNNIYNIKPFVKELIVSINDNVPNDIKGVAQSISIDDSWISRILNSSVNENQINILSKIKKN